jgi:hypothetical protein
LDGGLQVVLDPDSALKVINKSFPREGKLSEQVAIDIIINGIPSTSWSIWKMSMFMDYQTTQGMELPTCGIQLVCTKI